MQSPPVGEDRSVALESGEHAGYDDHERKKGSETHIAVNTLGHLLVLYMTPINEQDQAQVEELAQQVQAVTDQSAEAAFIDQGYTGDDSAQAVQQVGIE